MMSCSHTRYACSRDSLPGYDYCLNHILDDKNAPYKQCNFQLGSTKRCKRPAPKNEWKDGYCAEHTKKVLVERYRSGQRRKADVAQTCLEELEHYKKEKKSEEVPLKASCVPEAESSSNASENTTKVKVEDISKNKVKAELVEKRDIFDIFSNGVPTLSQYVMEKCDVEKEERPALMENCWKGDEDSDAESVDSDLEDPLKHAGVYTEEEVMRILRDKLTRLQKLYIEQFQRLHYLLKEERRKYRVALRQEKEEGLLSIHMQPKETPEEQKAYQEMKALAHYSSPHGVEAVLQAKLLEKRMRVTNASSGTDTSSNSKSSTGSKCSYNLTTSTKCGDVCVPMTKYCMKHILEDQNQVLFRACGVVTEADGPCETPIPNIFEESSCVYHTRIPKQIHTDEFPELKTEDIKLEEKNYADVESSQSSAPSEVLRETSVGNSASLEVMSNN